MVSFLQNYNYFSNVIIKIEEKKTVYVYMLGN